MAADRAFTDNEIKELRDQMEAIRQNIFANLRNAIRQSIPPEDYFQPVLKNISNQMNLVFGVKLELLKRIADFGIVTAPIVDALKRMSDTIEVLDLPAYSDVEIIIPEVEKDIETMESIVSSKADSENNLIARIQLWMGILLFIATFYFELRPDAQLTELQSTLNHQTSIIEQQASIISHLTEQNAEIVEITQEQLDITKKLVVIVRDVYSYESEDIDLVESPDSNNEDQEDDTVPTQEQESNTK